MTVPAESTLRVVNNTGRRAKLVLDGATRGEICLGGSAADVLFHRGPVSLALKPDCVLADESSVRVEVVAAPPAAAPAPPAAPRPRAPPAAPPRRHRQRRRYDDRRHRRPDHARRGPARTRPDSAATASAEPTTPAAEPTPADGTETATATIDGNLPALTEPTDSVTVAGADAEPLASVEPVRRAGRPDFSR